MIEIMLNNEVIDPDLMLVDAISGNIHHYHEINRSAVLFTH